MASIELMDVAAEPQLTQVRELFVEYADSLGFPLDFQGLAQELADLPGQYTPPGGCLLLAAADGRPAGCAALRSMGSEACEMKRLFIRPAWRGQGLGRLLAEAIIARARAAGYRRMLLDTIDTFTAANALYESLGFRRTRPYYHNPDPGAVFWELGLSSGQADRPA